eukprot:CAMPEP_0196643582 /NCGR_PEP_ID=MMETSP1085-20130531/6007_1 /TAXON_ID=41879 ORGANISM="Pycnococcus sp, Strain CCMP1998" /NCGR_SAMPLE_ID=MMETSP1085 /ASSEMBLY_ACC=CAM_ASM_000807 /LENGTH=258 /DNA_ID=CAMNT_0041973067 /DNA_START=27 /DNA_END=803 /DNA_ORIENTATION=+
MAGAGEVERTDYTPKSSFADDLRVLRAMWFGSVSGDSHQDQLESFYNKQAHLYDQYRHRMLHGRKPLMMNMPVKKGCVWVDLGGGTASNVEFFGKSVMTDWFKSVHVVDLTPSLVRVAKKRVEDNNWGGKVNIILGDATDPNLEGLPPSGSCDVVSISYAVTMIPNWRDVLKNAHRLLKPGGHICVCDFTVDRDSQWGISKTFWKYLFSTDHIYLSEEHIETLQSMFDQTRLEVNYGTFPYVPFFLKCPYYAYIGQKK